MDKEKKPRIIVPPYQADRRSREFEVVSAKGRCPFCGSALTDFQDMDGSIHTWCYNCQNHFR